MRRECLWWFFVGVVVLLGGCGNESSPSATSGGQPEAKQGQPSKAQPGEAEAPAAGQEAPPAAEPVKIAPPMPGKADVTPASWVLQGCEAEAPAGQAFAPVTTGEHHSCAVSPAGKLFCWGRNLDSELGDGTAQVRDRPTPVKGLDGVVQASAGFHHTCAVTKAGEAWCWGRNTEGQVGSGAGAEVVVTPVKVASCAAQVASGEDFSCALRRDGEVICWGNGDGGRLGSGSADDARTPVKVTGLNEVVRIAAGSDHACAVTKSGEVWCWGANGYKQLGSTEPSSSPQPIKVEKVSNATQVAAGTYHTCAISKGGALRCWGYNYYGQLGNGQTGSDATSAAPVSVNGIRNAVQVGLDENHTCAVTQGGQAYCWGHDGYGNLGGQERGDRAAPQKVANLADATAVSLGETFTCAARKSGAVACWGGGSSYLLGTPDPDDPYHPTDIIPDLASYTAAHPEVHTFPASGGVRVEPMVELSEGFACALRRNNGRPICWGSNGSGNLGDGTTVTRNELVEVQGLADAVELDIGESRVCARRADGTVACWGWLGRFNGSDQYSSSRPIPLEGITDAQGLVLGRSGILCVQRANNTISCMSSGRMSELAGLTDVVQMDAGVGFACAVKNNGQVWCWGSGSYGRLGNGSDTIAQTPVQVSGLTDATFVATGNMHACALRRNGTVSCWGQNEDGQLGNGQSGSGSQSTTPQAVPGLSDVISIAAGLDQTCALRSDGQTLCWGANGFGQAGLPVPEGGDAPESVATPTQIAAGTSELFGQMGNPVSVHASWHISCLLYQQGHLACWGTSSALGPGSLGGTFTRNARIPTPLQGIQLGTVAAAPAPGQGD